ncbi:MAG TPA: AAA family ATPase [Fimbriimonadaceae bacterium]|jgi:chromosome partitioning protein|nr:AAA family ATPase [Fimbriimonadaceae bacterium]
MELLTLSEAAAKVGVSQDTIERRIKDGTLSPVKNGARKMIRLDDLERIYPAIVKQPVIPPEGARVIAAANLKGGVGKTSIIANLAAILAEDGPTLAIDCDPQGNLTQALGANPDTLERTTYDVLIDQFPLKSAIIRPLEEIGSLYLLGANLELAAADFRLSQALAREMRLRQAIESVRKQFRWILVDCPPALGILTLNALTAANEVIIPVDPGVFSLRGVSKLMETFAEVRKVNPGLERIRPLANLVDKTNLAKDVRASLTEAFGEELFQTGIRRRNPIREAQAAKMPVSIMSPRDQATLDFRALAAEIQGLTYERPLAVVGIDE